ncbi:hypothetical protein HDU78_000464 [Chytriomyces hyalinus]|nr:hypothetical protein HDU78_000464 [Chytriomyces hyalinus]
MQNGGSYTEYRLVTRGGGDVVAHVARISGTSVAQMAKPITMHRRIPELLHLEDTLGTSLAKQDPDAPVSLSADVKANMASLAASSAKTPIDVDKIAPGSRTALHNMYANRNNPNKPYTPKFQKKIKQMYFGTAEDGEDPTSRAKKKDPDRYPWIIRDSASAVLTGSVEVNQAAADRVLFVQLPNEYNAFAVMPVTKIHKFKLNPKFHTLTAEEAEEKLKLKRQARWGNTPLLAVKKSDEEIAREIDGEDAMNLSKEDRAELARTLKRMNPTLHSSVLTSSARKTNYYSSTGAADGLNEDIDFDEVMSDDEHPDFGIENEDDAKEAKQREFGNKIRRANLDELEDEREMRRFQNEALNRSNKSKTQKKLQRALKKHNLDTYVSDDEINVYGEEEEESEPEPEPTKEAKETAAAAAAAAAKPSSPSLLSKDGKSPAIGPLPPSNPSPDPAKVAKQKKKEMDISGYDAESAARKAMYSGVLDTKNMRSLLNIKSSMPDKGKSATSLSAAGVANGPVSSPSLGAGTSPNLNEVMNGGSSSGTKIRLKVGKTAASPDVLSTGDNRKRKNADSPNLENKKNKTKGAPAYVSQSGFVHTAGSSSSNSMHQPVTMSATSPRLDELRGSGSGGSSRGRNTSPTLNQQNQQPSAVTPGLSPLISNSPTVPTSNDSQILTEADIRNLFSAARPTITVKEAIASLRDKLHFEGNKALLSQLLRRCCRTSADAEGTKTLMLRE